MGGSHNAQRHTAAQLERDAVLSLDLSQVRQRVVDEALHLCFDQSVDAAPETIATAFLKTLLTATEMKEKTFHVIEETRVNAPQSLLTIPRGTKIEVQCKDFTKYNTVISAASRLNKRLGGETPQFSISTPDNGATIIIERK